MGVHYGKANFITYGKPSLFLDFANKKSLVDRISGNNLITFTRTSTGTYVGADGLIKVAAADEPRFDHDPVTGECLGLLVEEARTNLKIRSEELQFDFGRASITTISQNEIVSPDGLQTTDGIVPNTTNTAHYLDKVFTSTSGITTSQNICSSIFVKKGVGRDAWWQIYEESGNAYHGLQFNFDTEELTFRNSSQYDTGGGVTTDYGISKYPNGWYRLWIAGYPNTTTTGRRVRIRLTDENGTDNFSGDASSSYLYAWGVQFEIGSFPTSYIPTSGSTVTRTADNASITGTNFSDWYNQSEGSISLEYSIKGFGTTTGFNRLFQIDDTTNDNRYSVLLNGTSELLYESFFIEGTNNVDYNTSTITYNDFYRLSVGFKQNDYYRYTLNASGNADSNTDDSIDIDNFSPTQLAFYEPSTNIRQLNGHMRSFTYYPRRLTNTQLQSLTQ